LDDGHQQKFARRISTSTGPTTPPGATTRTWTPPRCVTERHECDPRSHGICSRSTGSPTIRYGSSGARCGRSSSGACCHVRSCTTCTGRGPRATILQASSWEGRRSVLSCWHPRVVPALLCKGGPFTSR